MAASLVSRRPTSKLHKLTTYVLAAVEPPAKQVQIHTVSFRAAHPGSTVGLRLDSILINKGSHLVRCEPLEQLKFVVNRRPARSLLRAGREGLSVRG